MLTTLRQKTKIIMLVLAIAFVGWMVFDVGMGVTGRGDYASAQYVGRIGSRRVRYQDWAEVSRLASEEWRRQNPGVNQSREEQRSIEDAAFEQLVQDWLLQDEWRRRGMGASDREVRDAILNSPPPEVLQIPEFQTDGRFDIEKWRRYLSSSALRPEDEAALVQRYRAEIPRLKLYRQVTSDIYVPDTKLWQAWRDARDSVTVRALVIDPDEVVSDASVRIAEADLEAFYRAHLDDFGVPARAYLTFTALPRLPERVDSVAAVERARALRDSLARGADFAELARRESADSASREQGGELPTFGRGRMTPAFERAAFSLPVGRVSEPVVTPFGAHLIRVERRTADSVRARHILVGFERSGARLDSLEARADSLDRLAAEVTDDPTALDSAVALLGLGMDRTPPVIEGRPVALGRFVVPDVSVWAFEARPGETSPVIENRAAYYVFRLDSVQPAGVAPRSAVEAQVRVGVLRERKREATLEIARDAGQRLASGQTMGQVAQALRLEVRTIGPFTRTGTVPVLGTATAAVGTAFRLRLGERSRMLSGGETVFFIEPTRLVRADSAAWVAQREEQRIEFLRAARQVRLRFFLEGLRSAARVENGLDALRRRPEDAVQQ